MGRRRISMDERPHGIVRTYKAGCRCEKCTKAQSDYNAGLRAKAAEAAAATAGPPVLDELRIPVSCPNCGGGVVQQTDCAVTGSGLRLTVMLRCSHKGCARQWQFIGTLMSLSGSEYLGAA